MSRPEGPRFELALMRRGGKPIVAITFSWPGILVATLIVASLITAVVFAAITYIDSLGRLQAHEALNVEVDFLREQNRRLMELELELRELREFQHQMLGLAGIEPTLGAGSRAAAASEPSGALPGEDTDLPRLRLPLAGETLRGFDDAHPGIDIEGERLQPVGAAAGGTVMVSEQDQRWGHRVVVDHGSGLRTVYANADSSLVAPGDTVVTGQVIALVGAGFEGPDPHLHFEILLDNEPGPPEAWLPELVDP